MRVFSKILIVALAIFLGGIVLQVIGYIDSPLFAWFTNIEFFENL